jgi:hypothetical protein
MKKSRFSDAQIVSILKELDGGTPATELACSTAFTPIRFGCDAIDTVALKPAI